jgi:hypothetical protein
VTDDTRSHKPEATLFQREFAQKNDVTPAVWLATRESAPSTIRPETYPRAFVDSDTAGDRLADRTPELQRLATVGAGDAGSNPAAEVGMGTPLPTAGAIPVAGAYPFVSIDACPKLGAAWAGVVAR